MTTARYRGLVVLGALFFAPSAAWPDLTPVPDGCTARATILKESCVATTIFDCGSQVQTHTFDSGQLVALTLFTRDWELVEFRYPDENSARMSVVPGSGKILDMETLWATGESRSDAAFMLNTGILKDVSHSVSGTSRLTGETVVSGIPFRVGYMQRVFERTPGAGGLEFEIDLYVSREPDIVIEGAWSRSVLGANKQVFEQTPYAVALAGEPGFMATLSERGCD